MPTEQTKRYEVDCQECGAVHPAEPHHHGRFGEGMLYEITCTVDWLTDYYGDGLVREVAPVDESWMKDLTR
jgi:hypothetical protein